MKVTVTFEAKDESAALDLEKRLVDTLLAPHPWIPGAHLKGVEAISIRVGR